MSLHELETYPSKKKYSRGLFTSGSLDECRSHDQKKEESISQESARKSPQQNWRYLFSDSMEIHGAVERWRCGMSITCRRPRNRSVPER